MKACLSSCTSQGIAVRTMASLQDAKWAMNEWTLDIDKGKGIGCTDK